MTKRLSTARVAAAAVAALAVGAVTWTLTDPDRLSDTSALSTRAADSGRVEFHDANPSRTSRMAEPRLEVAPSTPPTSAASGGALPLPDRPAARPATPPKPVDQGQQPLSVRVADIDVTLPVVPLGVDDKGAMAIPASSFEAGWYRYGAGAGAPSGAVVVAAHVSSRASGPGPFARLKDLRPGAVVEVDTATGTIRYEVVSVERTPKRALDTQWLFDRGGEHRLHLVTCGGEYDRTARHYEDNVVVVARHLG